MIKNGLIPLPREIPAKPDGVVAQAMQAVIPWAASATVPGLQCQVVPEMQAAMAQVAEAEALADPVPFAIVFAAAAITRVLQAAVVVVAVAADKAA